MLTACRVGQLAREPGYRPLQKLVQLGLLRDMRTIKKHAFLHGGGLAHSLLHIYEPTDAGRAWCKAYLEKPSTIRARRREEARRWWREVVANSSPAAIDDDALSCPSEGRPPDR